MKRLGSRSATTCSLRFVHSWKSFTASEINGQLNSTGAFWQKESFDHIVRSTASLEKFRQYIRDNPKGAIAKK